MSYGRGGAGNLTQVVKPIETELKDFRRKSSASETPDEQQARRDGAQSPKDEGYFYSGRGGAGNLVASKVGAGNKSPTSDTLTAKPDSRLYGRGGVGNFDWSNTAEKEREEALKRKMELIRQSAERAVDSGLTKPGKAMLRDSDEHDDMDMS